MMPVPLAGRFSNGWLNFKHPFWAAASREQGIFAAIPVFAPVFAGNR
jgi:hypothetical protein